MIKLSEESNTVENFNFVKLTTNAIKWMTKDKSAPKVATNLETLKEELGTYVEDIAKALNDPDLDVFIVTKHKDWSQELINKLKHFLENGGHVIIAIGEKLDDSYPLRL